MGNYASDQKNAKKYTLKLSRNTDADIIEKLSNQGNVQAYIKALIRADIGPNQPSRLRTKDMTIEEARELEQRFNAELELFKKAAHD